MYSIYWIHLPSHTNVYAEGYVGLTKREVEHRINEHRTRNSKIPVEALVKILHSDLSEEKAKELEFQYRPSWKIGWNTAPGGMLGQRPMGIHTSGWKHNKPGQFENHSRAVAGKKNPMYGVKGLKNSRSKPFTIEGRLYATLTEASEKLDIRVWRIFERLKSADWPTYQYVDKKKAAPRERLEDFFSLEAISEVA